MGQLGMGETVISLRWKQHSTVVKNTVLPFYQLWDPKEVT